MSTEMPVTGGSLRKHAPAFRLPDKRALGALGEGDRCLLDRLLVDTAECVFNPLFEQQHAEAVLKQAPPTDAKIARNSDDSGVDMIISGADGEPLTIDEERHTFLKFNFARYHVLRILQAHEGKRLTAAATRELLGWERQVMDGRNDIVRQNLPLVLAMVKRTRVTGVDYSDLISEGNLALMRSVDKFDCARGYKFSTYACRSILKAFARVATRTARYRGYFPTEFDPTLEKSDFVEKKRDNVENDCVSELHGLLNSPETPLSDVEREVIKARFAIGIESDDAQTLEQVGHMIGVTKERVRQIQNKALIKLRSMLEEGVLAV